jgi:hypothetical protein
MVDCIAAEITRESAVQRGTHAKQALAWKRWCKYNSCIGSKDLFLESFSKHQRIKIVGAFALALWEGWFSGPAYDRLVESTISGTVSYVCATFRENGFPNPSLDDDARTGFLLQRLYRGFKNADPAEKHQKTIPMSVIAEIGRKTISELSIAVSQLTSLAIFFACRSCEYLKVPAADQCQTTILRLHNIRFFRNGELINHDDDELEFSDCVSLTFEKQKKDKKMDTVTQIASGDTKLCPVRSAAAIVRRIRGYNGTTADTPTSAVLINNRITQVTSENVINALRDAVVAIGEHRLGITKDQIGTHSIRSGAAMAMYLGECAVFTIMLIGRWLSDAFLRYIRKQVMEFSQNVAKKMITYQNFRHIPDIHRRIPRDDPRQRNNPNNAETRRNIGGNMSRQARLPAFSLYS